MAGIKVGVQVHPQHTSYADYRRAWLQLDDMGVDTIWNWDHFFPLYGDSNGRHFEAWTTLAAIGAQTRRAQIGCLVHCMSYRNPALLSAMAKTLDHATDGRLILGLGAGWARRDYNEYGYPFGTPGERLRNLERGLEIIKERWAKDQPRPVGGTIPILIGGGGEKVTLRITAVHADLWHAFGSADTWGRKNRLLDDWCVKVGRDPAAIERTVSINQHSFGDLDELVSVGARHIICSLGAPFELGPIERLLAWRDRR
ncbi:MAG TPA: LLM class F420-dependent oxidoreductase [Chloroflexota bacterium]|nr:LLM class F420-dependent oxidoreductase [Chloroflexota bacterium]